MDRCKELYRGDGARAWFPEVFVCNIPGRTVCINVFQPLFIALDQLREYEICLLNRDQLTTKLLSTFRPDHLYISYGLEECYHKQEDSVKKRCKYDKREFEYDCIRSLVFEEGGNTCVVSLDMLEEVVNIPDTGTVEDSLVAVMALFLWQNSHAGLSSQIQALQQSHLELRRTAASAFTALLHPLVHTFRQVFPESDPLLYSMRKRCTPTQINKLKHGLASSNKQQVSTTSTSLMSFSTSYAFCKRYEAIGEECDICPTMLTVQVKNTEMPMFVPVFEYVREDFENERNKEYEMLLLPGAEMVFRNIKPVEILARPVASTADVDIVGMDVSNILTQQEIAISSRVATMVMTKMLS
jgi:hypothetical protein